MDGSFLPFGNSQKKIIKKRNEDSLVLQICLSFCSSLLSTNPSHVEMTVVIYAPPFSITTLSYGYLVSLATFFFFQVKVNLATLVISGEIVQGKLLKLYLKLQLQFGFIPLIPIVLKRTF